MSLVLAAVISTLAIDGTVTDDGSDYVEVEFEVGEGVAEIEIAHPPQSDQNVLDYGLWSPSGFRGWGGGLKDNLIVGLTTASRGYLPGPVVAGTWRLVIGKAKLVDQPAAYTLEITLRDEETGTASPGAACADDVLGGPGWYAGDFHVHSRESGDASATLDDIETYALGQGLDFVVVTDHNTTSNIAPICATRGQRDVFLVPGVEITTYGGHGNAFGIREYVDHRVGATRSGADIVSDVVAQGGVFTVNHPKLDLGGACIGCSWEHTETPWQSVAAIEIQTGNFELSGSIFTPMVLTMWDALLDQGYRITAVGGSDDHSAGTDTGSTAGAIGTPTTVVWAEEMSERGLAAAVQQGRAVVKLRGPSEPDVELELVGSKGQPGIIGDTVAGNKVSLTARVQGGSGYDIVILRDGEVVEYARIDSDDHEQSWNFAVAEEGHRFRAHLQDGGRDTVITNHVFAEYEAPAGGCRVGARSRAAGAPLLLFLVTALLWRRRRAS